MLRCGFEARGVGGHEIKLPPSATAAEPVPGFQFKFAATARFAVAASRAIGGSFALAEKIDDLGSVHNVLAPLLLSFVVGQILMTVCQ